MMPRPCPSEVSAILPYEFQSFNFDLKFLWNWSFFHYEPKVLDLKKVFSNLEPEGQGRGIIKGVTRLLLLWPFYTIQINFMYYFAHDCTIVPSSHRIMMRIVRFYVMTLILTIYSLSFFRQCAAVSILFLPIMLPPQTCCPLNSLKVRKFQNKCF